MCSLTHIQYHNSEIWNFLKIFLPTLLNTIILVCLLFTLRHQASQYFSSWCSLFWRPAWEVDKMSSAYIKQFSFSEWSKTVSVRKSKYEGKSYIKSLNNDGLRLSPWRTPNLIKNYSVRDPPTFTQALLCSYILAIIL